MPNIEVKHLLINKRFTDNDWKFISLLLYLPIGIILSVLRAILAINLFWLGIFLPDSPVAQKVVNKILCLSLGLSINVQDIGKKEDVELYVSNNVSLFDNLVIHLVTGSVSHGKNYNAILAKCLGIFDFGNLSDIEHLKKTVTTVTQNGKVPLYFTPEEKSTNGKGLLKFKSYPFSVASRVQPICISIERPFLDISVFSIGSSYWTDIFFFMFSPLTTYKLRFLAALEKKSLADDQFAEAVRQNIALALNIETVNLTDHDLIEWEKRQCREQRRVQMQQEISPAFRRMALQVKEVLPHVPIDAITKDLCRTRNVDNTITNILEGRVRFIPEQQPGVLNAASTSGSSRPQTSKSSSSAAHLGISNFPKSAQDRNKTFQERKEQLIANARRRYIEKHNLNIPT